MLNRLGTWVVRYRWVVIAFWLCLLVPSLYGASHLHTLLQSEVASAPGTEMNRQEALLNQDFPQQNLYSIQVVLESKKHALSEPLFQQVLQQLEGVVRAEKGAIEPVGPNQAPEQASADGHSVYLHIGLNGRNLAEADQASVRIWEAAHQLKLPDDFKMWLTGGPLFGREITTVSAKDGFNTEKRILPLVMIVLVFAFGGLVAAGLPLIVGLLAVVISLATLYLCAHFTTITSLSQNIVSMLGLGVGIDYSLLFVSRYREELLERGLSKEDAAIHTLVSSGRTILYSGMVVSIGLLALLVPNVIFMRSLGLSGLITVGLTLLISLTLLPALLSLLGNKINSPQIFSRWSQNGWGDNQFWYRWAKFIMARPLFFSMVSIGILVSISLLSLEMKVWNPTIRIMPESLETRQGFEKILKIAPQHYFAPIVISFESKDGSPIWQQDNIEQAYRFMRAVNNQEPIRASLGLINADKPLVDQQVLYNTIAASGGVAGMQLFQPGANFPFLSQDERKGVLVAFHEHKGYIEGESDADLQTIQNIRDYRDQVQHLYPNLNILVGGLSAIPLEMKQAIFDHFPMIVLTTVVVTYLLTMFSFGSVLLPLKAVALNLLSVTATYGCMIMVFQRGWMSQALLIEQVPGALLIVSPLILFCIIFGLSMDYEIFLINRIREEYEACGDPAEAIALGLQKTGGIITNAGLIMIVVFLGFAYARIIVIKEFGFGLAVAIFLDATIIRLIVVPALMRLFGRASWVLPKFLDIPFLRNALRE